MGMNFEFLKETMIGFTVHALKKASSDEEIILKSKTLIKTWKKFVPAKEFTGDKQSTSSDKKESSSGSPKSNDSNEKPRKGTYKGNNGFYEYDGSVLFEDEQCRKRDGFTEKLPKRNTDGVTLIFPDQEEFRPNMTPKEVLQAGSFGGTYFRPIKSSVTNLKYNKMWDELPQKWIEGRWKNNLIGKIAKAGVKYNNPAISPVIRQTLQHWAYKLTEKDYLERKKQL